MQKRTREIVALVLLVLLIIAVALAMGWYILVGHNWNVAASNIDDSIGKMDDYTVFVFEGTKAPDYERELLSDSQPLLDDSNRGVSVSRRSDRQSANEPLEISRVIESYQDKGATVFRIDTLESNRYSEPYVVAKNGKRIGIASLPSSKRSVILRSQIRMLVKEHANYVIGVTDEVSMRDLELPDLDILISTDEAETSSDGVYVGQTYCVNAPYIGEVQAIILAPSGVLSTKTITSL